MEAILHDTETFNNLLRALDSGMTVYVYDGWGYSVVMSFSIMNEYDGLCISLHYGDSCYIYPSYDYDNDDLYTPTNISVPEPGSTEVLS